ncbi:hypothetical protein OH76DRAFT_279692 [Lentinus brumalis]|uniref:Uncharacterized protein n=1 Tax=Lentinus brumalis TaxID=2498619 RepID=A0A371CKY1_9APHY|nr:hypothetical protein OH76DRAFT_279692 [Polyporus brumalis]
MILRRTLQDHLWPPSLPFEFVGALSIIGRALTTPESDQEEYSHNVSPRTYPVDSFTACLRVVSGGARRSKSSGLHARQRGNGGGHGRGRGRHSRRIPVRTDTVAWRSGTALSRRTAMSSGNPKLRVSACLAELIKRDADQPLACGRNGRVLVLCALVAVRSWRRQSARRARTRAKHVRNRLRMRNMSGHCCNTGP